MGGARHGRLYERPIDGERRRARVENHGRTAGAGAMNMQPPSTDIDELSHRRIRALRDERRSAAKVKTATNAAVEARIYLAPAGTAVSSTTRPFSPPPSFDVPTTTVSPMLISNRESMSFRACASRMFLSS